MSKKQTTKNRDSVTLFLHSDRCEDYKLVDFVYSEYPELKNKQLDFIHDVDFMWFSDYNCGEPKGCFMIVVLFFK